MTSFLAFLRVPTRAGKPGKWEGVFQSGKSQEILSVRKSENHDFSCITHVCTFVDKGVSGNNIFGIINRTVCRKQRASVILYMSYNIGDIYAQILRNERYIIAEI